MPPLLSHKDFATLGEWIEALWWQYRCIVDDPGVRVLGKPVVGCGKATPDGRSEGFWHCITDSASPKLSAKPCRRDDPERTRPPGRVLSLHRGAMLGRTWAVLELLAAGDPRAVWWRESSCRGRHVFVADVNFTMVVVLHEGANVLRLNTQHPLRNRHDASGMQNRAAASWLRGLCSRDEHEVVVDRHPMWRLERRYLSPIDAAWRAAGVAV